jgi:mannose-1-phosphate guanylyltransferase/mannose-6-phosphate isomerase
MMMTEPPRLAHQHLFAVVLCGGTGSRLWPLSRQEFPKQFVPVAGDKSLLEMTLERARLLAADERVLCVAGEAHRFLTQDTLEAMGIDASVLLEPAPRNTAPALCCAALWALSVDRDAVLACLPADHHIADGDGFVRIVDEAVPAAQAGWWMTLGVNPDHASTAYGYIAAGAALGDGLAGYQVQRFIEKPDRETAARLVADGHLWNAGIFVVRADTLLEALARHAPAVADACTSAMASLAADGRFLRMDAVAISASPAISIDYAVLENHDRIGVLPFAGSWSDVGSWNAVAQVAPANSPDDGGGNRGEGDIRLVDCQNTYLYSPNRLTVALGLEDMVVIDTPDALLVARMDKAEDVRGIVEALKAEKREEVLVHRRVARPWGSFEGVDRGERFQVKRIIVKAGASLSLQYHRHRAEHWIVVNGTARVTCDGSVFTLSANESTFIPCGSVHRLENPGDDPLELIEVQSGSYLGEDDIVRLEDNYGRLPDEEAVRDDGHAYKAEMNGEAEAAPVKQAKGPN